MTGSAWKPPFIFSACFQLGQKILSGGDARTAWLRLMLSGPGRGAGRPGRVWILFWGSQGLPLGMPWTPEGTLSGRQKRPPSSWEEGVKGLKGSSRHHLDSQIKDRAGRPQGNPASFCRQSEKWGVAGRRPGHWEGLLLLQLSSNQDLYAFLALKGALRCWEHLEGRGGEVCCGWGTSSPAPGLSLPLSSAIVPCEN